MAVAIPTLEQRLDLLERRLALFEEAIRAIPMSGGEAPKGLQMPGLLVCPGCGAALEHECQPEGQL